MLSPSYEFINYRTVLYGNLTKSIRTVLYGNFTKCVRTAAFYMLATLTGSVGLLLSVRPAD